MLTAVNRALLRNIGFIVYFLTKCNPRQATGYQIAASDGDLCHISQNNVKFRIFIADFVCQMAKSLYFCNVFFMVLDLRLTKIGCREDNQFFLLPAQTPVPT